MRRVWICDREYRRRFLLDIPNQVVFQAARRFGGFKGLLTCREILSEASDPDHHLFGLCVYPRELQWDLTERRD